ncbi:hypothetical protein IFR05_000788 [Cadophora sp. M221]|nr:hypothetical protein IFR05_000788 [Cadophora sp. M221]
MQTRSALATQILEERKKRRLQRKERELRDLLRSAGHDRPETKFLEDFSVRRTRYRKEKETLRLSSLQVVIESQPRQPNPGESSKGISQGKEELSTESIATEISAAEVHDSGALVAKSEAVPRAPTPDNTKKTPGTKALSSLSPDAPLEKPVNTRKRRLKLDKILKKQLGVIRFTIKQTLRNPTKTDSGILKGLKKAKRKLLLRASRRVKGDTPKSQQNLDSPTSTSAYVPILILHGNPRNILTPPTSRELEASSEEDLDASRLSPTKRQYSARHRKQAPRAPDTWKNLPQTVDYIVSMPSTMAVQEPSSDQGSQTFELTDKCHHYTKIGQVEYDIQKYWQQRFSIWSLYNEGIYMTDDAWFGVTPEPVANKVAEDFAALIPETKTILIDMFAGAGGNVIAFALSSRWTQIIAIEKDASVIACAQHNAAIYGVADQITWINDDSFAYLAKYSSSIDPAQTVVFASPPWGGPRYMEGDIFNLSKMQPYSIEQIYEVVKAMDSALYLPRGSDLRQIARLAPGEKKIEVVQYCVYGASKAMVAYIPAISAS